VELKDSGDVAGDCNCRGSKLLIDDRLSNLKTLVQLKLQFKGGEFAKGAAVYSDGGRVNLGDLGSDYHVINEDAEAESEVTKSDACGYFSGTIKFVGPELHVYGGEASHDIVRGSDIEATERFNFQVNIKGDVGTVEILDTGENKFYSGI
jgi:hypothetical protein